MKGLFLARRRALGLRGVSFVQAYNYYHRISFGFRRLPDHNTKTKIACMRPVFFNFWRYS